jgi:alpha-mannosidase
VNNYGDTNFPQIQNGPVKLHYGLLTLPTHDPDQIAEHATRLRNPPLAWPVTTNGHHPSHGEL